MNNIVWSIVGAISALLLLYILTNLSEVIAFLDALVMWRPQK